MWNWCRTIAEGDVDGCQLGDGDAWAVGCRWLWWVVVEEEVEVEVVEVDARAPDGGGRENEARRDVRDALGRIGRGMRNAISWMKCGSGMQASRRRAWNLINLREEQSRNGRHCAQSLVGPPGQAVASSIAVARRAVVVLLCCGAGGRVGVQSSLAPWPFHMAGWIRPPTRWFQHCTALAAAGQ